MSIEHRRAGIPELVRFSGRKLANLPGFSHINAANRRLEQQAMDFSDFAMIREVEARNKSEMFLRKRGDLLLFISPPLAAVNMIEGDYAAAVALFLASLAVVIRAGTIENQKEILFKVAEKRGMPGLRLFDHKDQTKAIIAYRQKQTANP